MVKKTTPVPEILCIGHWQGQSLWKSCCSLWLEVTPLATYLFFKQYLCFPISYLSNLSRVVQQHFHLSKPEIFWPYNLLPYQVCNKNIYLQLERGKGEWNSDTPGKKKNFWSQSHAILIKMAQNVFALGVGDGCCSIFLMFLLPVVGCVLGLGFFRGLCPNVWIGLRERVEKPLEPPELPSMQLGGGGGGQTCTPPIKPQSSHTVLTSKVFCSKLCSSNRR